MINATGARQASSRDGKHHDLLSRALRAQLVEETEHFRPVKPEAEGVKKQVYTGPNIEEATFVHYEHNPEVRRSLPHSSP